MDTLQVVETEANFDGREWMYQIELSGAVDKADEFLAYKWTPLIRRLSGGSHPLTIDHAVMSRLLTAEARRE